MTVKKAKDLLGRSADNYSDEQIQELITRLTVLADIAIDQAITQKPNNYRKRLSPHNKYKMEDK